MEENLKKEIKISEVLQLLQEGYTRDQIAVKYGISQKELKYLFQHPKLKGKKTIKGIGIAIVDDSEEVPESLGQESPQLQDVEEGSTFSIANAETPTSPEEVEPSVVVEESATETINNIELSN